MKKEVTFTDAESYSRLIITQKQYIGKLENTVKAQCKMIKHLETMIFQQKRIPFKREWFSPFGEFDEE